jgi:hypothetical protein
MGNPPFWRHDGRDDRLLFYPTLVEQIDADQPVGHAPDTN